MLMVIAYDNFLIPGNFLHFIVNSLLGKIAGIFNYTTGSPATENVFNSERENHDKMLK
jgi:hypothetical protein